LGNITVEKGSVCVNGVSLTCFNAINNGFTVAIIPYTYEHTNFKSLKAGDTVNLEFDIMGKYVKRLLGKAVKYRQFRIENTAKHVFHSISSLIILLQNFTGNFGVHL
jgi:riboflavin synthase alpha subunit